MEREIKVEEWNRFNLETSKYEKAGAKIRLRFEVHKLPDPNAYGVAFVWAYDQSASKEAMVSLLRRFLDDMEAGRLG